MKQLQKVLCKSKEGKVTKENIGGSISVIDSVADDLIVDGEIAIKRMPNKGNHSVTVYEVDVEVDVEEVDVEVEEAAFDVSSAKKSELIDYAKENGIDLGEANTAGDIRIVVMNSINQNK